MTGLRSRFLLLALFCLTVTAPAHADKRVALIIGNSAYRSVTPLDNPKNDAALMAETLRGLGFTLVGGGPQLDLDKASIDRAVQKFGDELLGADVGLFYYAGHGLQLRGGNYLVPVDANPVRETDVDFQMLDANLVLRQMEAAGTKLNLVIFDACRNNPFGGRGLRAVDRGLAIMQAPEGTLISFATQPGNVARDGTDGNSPFTRALAQTMRKPGLDVFRTFNEVGLVVARATAGMQQPWLSLSPIKGDFFFAGEGSASATVPSPPPAAAVPTADEIFWLTIKDSGVAALFEEFLKKYPASPHVEEARARLEELKKSQMAVVAPPTVPAAPAGPCGGAGAITVSLARASSPLSAAEECSLKPKDTFKECASCPEMVVVPPGTFTMGSPESEPGRYKDEGPRHDVTFKRPFAVGKFEVTVDQFAAFAMETGYDAGSKCYSFQDGKFQELDGRSWRNPGFPQTSSHPAACLNWNDATAYVRWVSQQTGKGYRLLTEAEYEYATRAMTAPGAAPRYFFGDDDASFCQYGNGADQTAKKDIPGTSGWTFLPCNDGFAYTAPVGSFKPNGFGLYDMSGNLWSWTEDCYHDSYDGAPTDGTAWTAGDCSRRVVRGGSWYLYPQDLRSANRSGLSTDNRNYYLGFRVGRTLTP